MTQEERLALANERIVLEAREKLKSYYVNSAHPRYHKCMSGVAYIIPMGDVDFELSKYILILLKSRKCLLGGIRGSNYVIYQNSNKDILTFSRDIVHSTTGLRDVVKKKWYDHFGDSKKFYITFSLERYFNDEGIADMLDRFMSEDTRVVLSMLYPNHLTMMALDENEIGIV